MEEGKIRDILGDRHVFPVPCAGIHPGIVPQAVADSGTNVILNTGTEIMDHPDGAAIVVRAFFEALERVSRLESFELENLPYGGLRRSRKKWGRG